MSLFHRRSLKQSLCIPYCFIKHAILSHSRLLPVSRWYVGGFSYSCQSKHCAFREQLGSFYVVVAYFITLLHWFFVIDPTTHRHARRCAQAHTRLLTNRWWCEHTWSINSTLAQEPPAVESQTSHQTHQLCCGNNINEKELALPSPAFFHPCSHAGSRLSVRRLQCLLAVVLSMCYSH